MLPLLLFGTMGLAAAHVLRQDNGIAAELHIPPDDKPLAGQQTKLELSFGDSRHAFSLQNCDCQLSVERSSVSIQKLALQPATPSSMLSSTPTVRFPAVGQYNVVVQGSAKNGTFSSFSLTYPVDIQAIATRRMAADTKSQSTMWTLIIIATAVLIIAGGITLSYKRK